VGTGVAVWLITPGMLVVTNGPEVLFTRVSAKTTPGSMNRIIHITAVIRRNPEDVPRSWLIENPNLFFAIRNIVMLVLKYGRSRSCVRGGDCPYGGTHAEKIIIPYDDDCSRVPGKIFKKVIVRNPRASSSSLPWHTIYHQMELRSRGQTRCLYTRSYHR
jgi:hypothetical protein